MIQNKLYGKFTLKDKNDLEGGFYLWHTSNLQSEFDVAIVSDLRCDFNVVISADLKCELNVFLNSDLNCDIDISSKNSLECNFGIPPHNKLYGKVEIQPPPTKEITCYPVRDAYVSTRDGGVLNYGDSHILKVGLDDKGYKYRTLITFDRINIDKTNYIKSAKLILKSYAPFDEFIELELGTIRSHFQEYSVVWAGQPLRQDIVEVKDVKRAEWQVEFDVTSLIRNNWHLFPENARGFIIKAQDETIEQIKNFYSRENIQSPDLIPELKIEYYDIANNIIFNKDALEGQFNTVEINNYSDLNGFFDVYRENDKTSLLSEFHLLNPDMVEGDFIIPSQNDIGGSFYVIYTNDIYGSIRVAEKGLSFLDGFIGVEYYDEDKELYYRDIYGDINIAYDSYLFGELEVVHLSDLECSFNIMPSNSINGNIQRIKIHDSLDGQINIEQYDIDSGKNFRQINGEFYVIYISDLDSNFYISNNNNLECLLDIYYNKELSSEFELVNGVELYGNINIANNNDLDCNINISDQTSLQCGFELVTVTDLPSSFYIADSNSLEGSFHTHIATDLECSIYNITAISQIEGSAIIAWKGDEDVQVEGDFIVIPKEKSSLDCSIDNVIALKDIDGSINISVPADIDLSGIFRVKAITAIEGQFEIPQSFVEGSFNVKAKNDLDADIYIANNTQLQGEFYLWITSHVYGDFVVIPRQFNDLSCEINFVDGVVFKNRKSYGFIM